jgi:hypothetical protein
MIYVDFQAKSLITKRELPHWKTLPPSWHRQPPAFRKSAAHIWNPRDHAPISSQSHSHIHYSSTPSSPHRTTSLSPCSVHISQRPPFSSLEETWRCRHIWTKKRGKSLLSKMDREATRMVRIIWTKRGWSQALALPFDTASVLMVAPFLSHTIYSLHARL